MWKYRGQVVPSNKRIRTTAQIVETGRDARGAYVLADASLWVDEKQIYRCATIGMRIVEGKAPRFDIEPIRDYWRTELGVRAWPGEDVYRALVTSFVRRARFADEAALRSLGPRGVLYLANHQVAVESTGFALVASALSRSPIVALAKVENRRHWLELVMDTPSPIRASACPAWSFTSTGRRASRCPASSRTCWRRCATRTGACSCTSRVRGRSSAGARSRR